MQPNTFIDDIILQCQMMLDNPEKYQVQSGADSNILTSLTMKDQDTFIWHQFWLLLESVYPLLCNASLSIVYTDTWSQTGSI